MRISSTARSQRRWPKLGVMAVACTLAMNSAFAINGGPFAFVPAGNSGAHSFSVIDTSTKTVVAPDVDVNPDGVNTGKQSNFFGVAVSPKTNMLFLSDDGNSEAVFQVDIAKIGGANSTVKYYFVGNNVRGLAVDPSGGHVFATSFGGGSLAVIDTTVDNHTNHTLGVSFIDMGNRASPYDVKLNLAGTAGYVTDASDNQRLCRFNPVTPPTAVADCVEVAINQGTLPNPTELVVSPDGARVYVVNSHENSISVVDTTHPALTVLRSFKLQFGGNVLAGPNGIAMNPSGKRAYVVTSLGHILSLDLALAESGTDAFLPEAVVHDIANAQLGNLNGTTISADGTHLLVADSAANKLHFVNIAGNADVYEGAVDVHFGPKSYGQFATPNDRIFVSEIGVSAVGG
jgi:DNA-binding beta-propeller fold protein YncE